MNAPRLMDQIVAAMRSRHDSIRTERAYRGWIRRFIRFHGMCHARELGTLEPEFFLSDLAVTRRASAPMQSQALAALSFEKKRPGFTPGL